MCLPEDLLHEECVWADMNQAGSSHIALVWNSCWPDGVLMGTFICFFITTKMSYILTLLLPLFPKGCQHQSHYNTTARGNFFPPSHIISSNDSVKRERTRIQKLLVKEQCSVMWGREGFLNACQSLPLLLRETSTGTAWICLGTGVCAVPGTLRMGFATGALQVMGTVTISWPVGPGSCPMHCTPYSFKFLMWEHKDSTGVFRWHDHQ